MSAERGSTVDGVCRGSLQLEQPGRGYRFNLDAILLAQFCLQQARTPRAVVDLGAGCGVVGLLLAKAWPESAVHLVELQPELAALGRANVVRNALGARARVHEVDLHDYSEWPPTRSGELLAVCNPPFFSLASGRMSPDPQVALARHEIRCTVETLAAAAARALKPGDHLAMIHLTRREGEVLRALERDFVLRRLRRVHALPERPSQRVLLLAERRTSGARRGISEQVVEEPPLLVALRPGQLSEELRAILEPQAAQQA